MPRSFIVREVVEYLLELDDEELVDMSRAEVLETVEQIWCAVEDTDDLFMGVEDRSIRETLS